MKSPSNCVCSASPLHDTSTVRGNLERLVWASSTSGEQSDVTSGSLEPWDRTVQNQIQTSVAIFPELKYFCVINSICKYRDPNMADFLALSSFLQFAHFWDASHFLNALHVLWKLSPRERKAYHNMRKWKFRDRRDLNKDSSLWVWCPRIPEFLEVFHL